MNKISKLILTCIMSSFIIPVYSVFSKEAIELIEVYPSEPTAFTQGLEFKEDQLLLGTGLYGQSQIGVLDYEQGEFQVIDQLDAKYFGEGITVTSDHIWQLTWQEGVAFKRDKESFEVIEEASYQGEGWGLAYDEDQDTLWMSDGSANITQRDPNNFDELDKFEVTINQNPVHQLNELEYVDGYLYANVWYTNLIIAINLETKEVEYIYDFSEIIESELTEAERQQIDTFNGIAHYKDDIFFVTGKNFPKIFQVRLLRN